eukprot:scaffold865_cov312-Prasinococcus_capsulatus_cf.AAC.15
MDGWQERQREGGTDWVAARCRASACGRGPWPGERTALWRTGGGVVPREPSDRGSLATQTMVRCRKRLTRPARSATGGEFAEQRGR